MCASSRRRATARPRASSSWWPPSADRRWTTPSAAWPTTTPTGSPSATWDRWRPIRSPTSRSRRADGMGVLTGLLTLPLAPVRGVVMVAELLGQEAERELAALASPERALADLEAAHAAGEMSDEELATRQAALIDQVIAARTGGEVI